MTMEEELKVWWGPDSSQAKRLGLLHDDILKGFQFSAEPNGKDLQRWFILGKEVCKNFYLRARGMQKSTVNTYCKDFLAGRVMYLGAVARDKKHDNAQERYHRNVIPLLFGFKRLRRLLETNFQKRQSLFYHSGVCEPCTRNILMI